MEAGSQYILVTERTARQYSRYLTRQVLGDTSDPRRGGLRMVLEDFHAGEFQGPNAEAARARFKRAQKMLEAPAVPQKRSLTPLIVGIVAAVAIAAGVAAMVRARVITLPTMPDRILPKFRVIT
jgi:hypothetical protein